MAPLASADSTARASRTFDFPLPLRPTNRVSGASGIAVLFMFLNAGRRSLTNVVATAMMLPARVSLRVAPETGLLVLDPLVQDSRHSQAPQ